MEISLWYFFFRNQFKARPVNTKVLSSSNLGIKKVPSKPVTLPEEFALSSGVAKKNEEEEHYEFHANPLNKKIMEGTVVRLWLCGQISHNHCSNTGASWHLGALFCFSYVKALRCYFKNLNVSQRFITKVFVCLFFHLIVGKKRSHTDSKLCPPKIIAMFFVPQLKIFTSVLFHQTSCAVEGISFGYLSHFSYQRYLSHGSRDHRLSKGSLKIDSKNVWYQLKSRAKNLAISHVCSFAAFCFSPIPLILGSAQHVGRFIHSSLCMIQKERGALLCWLT